ncbi:MAG TPA: porin [Caldimonas sp.]
MNRFASNAVAAALACAACASVHAQPAATIYGLLDMSAGRFQEPGSAAVRSTESGGMSTSFLGIRGGDDLGGGLRARFGLETFIRVNEGAAGRSATDAFWGRTAYAGLQGAFGTSLLGRLPTPLWLSTRLFNPFGDSLGFSPAIRQYFGGSVLGDSRWNNSVAFSSPEVENGLSYSFQLNGNDGGVGATGRNVGANFIYTSGPLAATVAWQHVRNGAAPLPAGFDHQSVYQIGASYELRWARLFGQAGIVKTRAALDVKSTPYQFGVAVPIGLGFVLASYGHAGTDSAGSTLTRKTVSLGYDHYLSKSTDIYAVLMNEQATGLASANTVAAGVRLRF